MQCMLCYADVEPQGTVPVGRNAMPKAALIVPPHIENKLLDLSRIEVSYGFLFPLNFDLSLALREEKSHPAIERPLRGERPAEHHGVPREKPI